MSTIPVQNSNINFGPKPPFSSLLQITWVKVVMLFYSYITRLCVECYCGCLRFVRFPIYVPVCVVCFMFDCVGEVFVECVCYLCGRGDCFLFELKISVCFQV